MLVKTTYPTKTSCSTYYSLVTYSMDFFAEEQDIQKILYLKKGVGSSYMAKHGNWPIFLTKFGKTVYILADFGNQKHCWTQKFIFWRTEYGKTDIA